MLRGVCIVVVLLWLVATLVVAGASLASTSSQIDVLRVDGTIVPAVGRYIDRGIGEAESQQATAIVIELNTPGGLLPTTDSIADRILDAEVPVLVYVER
jgi:membrane-bound serine protease (ClpP class)